MQQVRDRVVGKGESIYRGVPNQSSFNLYNIRVKNQREDSIYDKIQ